MDPEKKSLNFIFPTKYVIPKSLKFSHWPSKYLIDPYNGAHNKTASNVSAATLSFCISHLIFIVIFSSLGCHCYSVFGKSIRGNFWDMETDEKQRF